MCQWGYLYECISRIEGYIRYIKFWSIYEKHDVNINHTPSFLHLHNITMKIVSILKLHLLCAFVLMIINV